MSNLPEPLPPRELRASDADRERVAAVLREAAGEGRIGLDELDERLASVYAARTYADLEPLTRDLPSAVKPEAPVERINPDRFGGEPTSAAGFALLGGFERKGNWVVPGTFEAFAMLGGGDIDLRQARFAERKVVIRVWAILGGVQVTVPEDAEVHVAGVGILGGFDNSAAGAGTSGGPVVVVKGMALLGGVSVERKATDDVLKQRKLERKEERQRRKLERKQLKPQ
ncbi:DUF1707 SHOCT-like domain-containing protein [Virgisporangium aurantiacum]|uniref:DUF1707 domain-containing protein n=1 Tax=Virgisporangium aurantiacum TaxID=175570 RepID=A0A8J3Z0R0_9ACTN|nr:DUF1707 domain-containing protein [Virgisporangium aurantiacum]GIJ55336.1 hypothetical protein Vau01_028520 [Virgisporangium aurantiacum]